MGEIGTWFIIKKNLVQQSTCLKSIFRNYCYKPVAESKNHCLAEILNSMGGIIWFVTSFLEITKLSKKLTHVVTVV